MEQHPLHAGFAAEPAYANEKGWGALPSGRKEVAALLWTKQTNWKYLRGSKTQNNSTLRQKDLLKAHSRAPGCVGRHIHARTQFPAEQPEFFEEWFRQTGKLSMDLSPWQLHSIPGSTFRGPQTHTLSKRFNGMIQQLQESQSRRRRTANTVELIWDYRGNKNIIRVKTNTKAMDVTYSDESWPSKQMQKR